MSKICGNCGAVLSEEARFCAKCGTPVEAQPVAEEVKAEKAIEEVQPSKEAVEAPVEQEAVVIQEAPVTEVLSEETAQDAEEEQKPAPEEKSEDKKEKKARKEKEGGHKVLRGMLTVLLCILLFVAGLSASVTFSARRVTSRASLSAMMDKVDFGELRTGILSENGRKETIPEILYNNSTYVQQQFYSVRDLDKLVNRDFVKEFVAEQLSQYIDDIFRGNGEGIIEVEEVEEFLLDNRNAINKTLGVDWSDSAYQLLAEFVEKSGLEEASDLSGIREEHRGIFWTIRIVFSYPMMVLLAILMILLIWAILAANKYKNGGFYGVSVCFGILALIQLAVAIFAFFGATVLNNLFALGTEIYEVILAPIRNQGLILGGAYLAVALIMIAVAGIKSRIANKKK